MNCSIFRNKYINIMEPAIMDYPGNERLHIEAQKAEVLCDGQWHIWKMKGGYELATKCPNACNDFIKYQINKYMPGNDKTFGNFDVKKKTIAECVNIVKQFPYSGKRGLIITGPCLSGKTHSAKALFMDVIEHGRTCAFYHVKDFHEIIINKMKFNADSMAEYEEIYNKEFLIIDDLGAESTTDFFNSELLYLLENYKGKLVITTNFQFNSDNKNLNFPYEERIMARLKNLERFERVLFKK